MAPADRDEALDLLIARRRRGEAAGETPIRELEDLASTAETLRERWGRASRVDADAVWVRVRGGMADTPQRRRLRRWYGGAPLGWATARRATAVAVVVVVAAVAVFAALTPDRGSSAAFVRDVARLSDITRGSDPQNGLAPDQQVELARLSSTMLDRVTRRPQTLDELDANTLAVIALALSHAELRLGRLAEAEDLADSVANPDADGEPPLAVSSSLPSLSSVAAAVDEVRSSRGGGGGVGLAAACDEAADQARAVCRAAVEAAQAACTAATDERALNTCEALVEIAEKSCALLEPWHEIVCLQGLDNLEESTEDRLDPDDDDDDDDEAEEEDDDSR